MTRLLGCGAGGAWVRAGRDRSCSIAEDGAEIARVGKRGWVWPTVECLVKSAAARKAAARKAATRLARVRALIIYLDTGEILVQGLDVGNFRLGWSLEIEV